MQNITFKIIHITVSNHQGSQKSTFFYISSISKLKLKQNHALGVKTLNIKSFDN